MIFLHYDELAVRIQVHCLLGVKQRESFERVQQDVVQIAGAVGTAKYVGKTFHQWNPLQGISRSVVKYNTHY